MSYVRIAERQLDTVRSRNPELNALITVSASVLDDARNADKAASEGRSLGLLHGMTVSVKDNIDAAGMPATAGAAFRRDRIPNRNAPVVQRLLNAGAIVLGKANMAEVAWGIRSRSAVGGQCRNPWNPQRIPGGSSGGSGVSVAAGMCSASLGTDTGGSVRLPAAFNGVSGLRPTSGRVPNSGTLPVSEPHDTVGPIARSVDDVARVFSVIAGYDPEDPGSVDTVLPNFLGSLHDGIAGMVVAIPKNHYFDDCDAGVVKSVQTAAAVLERLGARLVERTIPMVEDAQEMATRVIFSDVCALHRDRLMNEPESFSPDIFERMKLGLGYTGVEYAEGMAFKLRWKRVLRDLFSDVDILISPTAPTGAPLIDDGQNLFHATRKMTKNTFAGAFGNIPGLSVPCGFTQDGLPIGLQLESAWWREPILLRAGVAYQSQTDFHLQDPFAARH